MCICGEPNKSYKNKSKSVQTLISGYLYLQNIENTPWRIHTVSLSYIALITYYCLTTIPKFNGLKQ